MTIEKIKKILCMEWPDKHYMLKKLVALIFGIVIYRRLFGKFGKGSILEKPLRLENASKIYIGNEVHIAPGAILEAMISSRNGEPKMIIEDGVSIQTNVHIIAHCNVIIRKNVGIGHRCFISDAHHPFMDVHDPLPIRKRLSTAQSFVEIGEGALIGHGTFIAPNVRIGKGSVIGANSVVRKNIPDYCVAAGNPAKIELKFDITNDRWSRV